MTVSHFRKLFDLTGRSALVTGGCGIIGTRLCHGLADLGASVAIVDLDAARTTDLAAELRATYKVPAFGYACDIVEPTHVQELKVSVDGDLGDVSILFNNAAAKTPNLADFFTPVENFRLDLWRHVTAVNLDGMFNVAQVFGGAMARNGYGSIIQTSSIYGVVAPDQRIYEGSEYLGLAINTPAIYSTTKAGVIGLTRHLATYWGHRGVRVNAISPGGVRSGQNQRFVEQYSARVPLGRMAEADEIVSAGLFLASDASKYITGQNLVVDGGMSCW